MAIDLYRNLPTISNFNQVTDLSHFVEVGPGWSVLLSDIKGSTKAIEQGRYKDINLLGVAMISGIQNVLGTRHFPFVFGGDGSTVLLPNDLCDKVKPALHKLQKLAAEQFGFELRIGIVPVEEVIANGGKILLAKYEMAPGNYLAMIQGGGLQVAERMIKLDPNSRFQLAPTEVTDAPLLNSLSCRWSPLQNRNGMMVSLLVHAVSVDQAAVVYQQILTEIHPIFESEEHRPVSSPALKLENFFSSLMRELRLRRDLSPIGVFKSILIPMVFSRVARRFPKLSAMGAYNGYLRETLTHSDYKKLDDTLRMVLDCSAEQVARLEAVLERFHSSGKIFFGMHRSSSALMTCMVEGLSTGQHLHFIDGSDGGYAMAAKNMKAQMKLQAEKTLVSA